MVNELIRQRKSVRSFDGTGLRAEDRRALEEYMNALANPFSVPVRFQLLDAKEHGLTSPVIVGADTYLAAKLKRVPNFELACGYDFEKVCLFALSRGMGTVMLAASMNRPAFEAAMDVGSDEVMPVVSPVGYPAEKRSVQETLMRKGLRADERKPFDQLFFAERFGRALPKGDPFAEALEMARWAPSAANRQPCRAVVEGEWVHFYEAKSMKDSPLGDIQRLDIGIALAHFEMCLEEKGVRGTLTVSDPGIPVPEDTVYVISYRRL